MAEEDAVKQNSSGQTGKTFLKTVQVPWGKQLHLQGRLGFPHVTQINLQLFPLLPILEGHFYFFSTVTVSSFHWGWGLSFKEVKFLSTLQETVAKALLIPKKTISTALRSSIRLFHCRTLSSLSGMTSPWWTHWWWILLMLLYTWTLEKVSTISWFFHFGNCSPSSKLAASVLWTLLSHKYFLHRRTSIVKKTTDIPFTAQTQHAFPLPNLSIPQGLYKNHKGQLKHLAALPGGK